MTPPLEEQPMASDEISLRELYLIVKRGLLFIVGVAVLAGLLAFVITSLSPKVYQAQSSTLVAPPPVSVQASGGLSLSPGTSLPFETYQTLAFSQPVLEKVIQAVPQAKLTVTELRRIGNLEELIGPQSQSQIVPLEVVHKVTTTDPHLAAELANAWAKNTVAAVQSSLLANLTPVSATTSSEVAKLKTGLDDAEAAYQAFSSQNNLSLLQAREKSLSAAIDDAENQLVTLPELATLPGGNLQNAPQVNLQQEITANETLLQSLRQQAGQNPSQLLEQQIVFRQALLSSLKARQTLLARQLADYRGDYQQVEQELAEVTAKGDELKRNLDNASAAYQNVATLEPSIAYLSTLAPQGARIFSSAAVPAFPVGPHRLRNTALAFVIGGILALLFVFLRRAVGPEAATARLERSGEYVSVAEAKQPSQSRV